MCAYLEDKTSEQNQALTNHDNVSMLACLQASIQTDRPMSF